MLLLQHIHLFYHFKKHFRIDMIYDSQPQFACFLFRGSKGICPGHPRCKYEQYPFLIFIPAHPSECVCCTFAATSDQVVVLASLCLCLQHNQQQINMNITISVLLNSFPYLVHWDHYLSAKRHKSAC